MAKSKRYVSAACMTLQEIEREKKKAEINGYQLVLFRQGAEADTGMEHALKVFIENHME